jgi:hypothetical protein
MPTTGRFIVLFLATALSANAQTPSAPAKPVSITAALGPTHTYRGVDAIGIHAEAGVALTRGRGFGLRLEGTGHWYEAQPLYPCLIQDTARCYQTLRRSVNAGIVSATYHIARFSTEEGKTVPYLITGFGLYNSRRVATRYPDCQPAGICDRNTYKLELRDTQYGLSGGIGLDFAFGSLKGFGEARLHYVYRDSPSPGPTNDYFLAPLSIGLRF